MCSVVGVAAVSLLRQERLWQGNRPSPRHYWAGRVGKEAWVGSAQHYLRSAIFVGSKLLPIERPDLVFRSHVSVGCETSAEANIAYTMFWSGSALARGGGWG